MVQSVIDNINSPFIKSGLVVQKSDKFDVGEPEITKIGWHKSSNEIQNKADD